MQVVDGSDRVVSASVNADRLSALLSPRELASALAGGHPVVPGSRVGRDSDLRVTARAVRRAGDARTVVVAQQFDDIVDSQHVLRTTLLVTYPLLLLVLALIASRVIAAALRPVEALRSTAERISGAGQETRLPVPESRDEIHDLAVTLNSMLDRLAAGRARQRSFVADAAHELRSPLASMVTQLDAAERLGEDTGVTEDLRAEVDRMVGLVDGLLVLARLDRETTADVPPAPVALAPLARASLRRHRNARVDVQGDVPDLLVAAHEDAVRRVLDNLLDNAVRHATSSVSMAASLRGRARDAGGRGRRSGDPSRGPRSGLRQVHAPRRCPRPRCRRQRPGTGDRARAGRTRRGRGGPGRQTRRWPPGQRHASGCAPAARAGRSELTNTQSFIAPKRSTVTPRLASVSTTTSAPRLGELTACSSHSEPVVAASPAAKRTSPCT